MNVRVTTSDIFVRAAENPAEPEYFEVQQSRETWVNSRGMLVRTSKQIKRVDSDDDVPEILADQLPNILEDSHEHRSINSDTYRLS